MTHSEAAVIAAEKYPIYDRDIPELGIKKTCAIDRRILTGLRERLIEKLLNEQPSDYE